MRGTPQTEHRARATGGRGRETADSTGQDKKEAQSSVCGTLRTACWRGQCRRPGRPPRPRQRAPPTAGACTHTRVSSHDSPGQSPDSLRRAPHAATAELSPRHCLSHTTYAAHLMCACHATTPTACAGSTTRIGKAVEKNSKMLVCCSVYQGAKSVGRWLHRFGRLARRWP